MKKILPTITFLAAFSVVLILSVIIINHYQRPGKIANSASYKEQPTLGAVSTISDAPKGTGSVSLDATRLDNIYPPDKKTINDYLKSISQYKPKLYWINESVNANMQMCLDVTVKSVVSTRCVDLGNPPREIDGNIAELKAAIDAVIQPKLGAKSSSATVTATVTVTP